MNLWRSLRGQVEVQLTSADIPGAMAAINGQGIAISRVEYLEELTVRFTIDRASFYRIRTLAVKRGDALTLCRRRGLYFALQAAIQRPVLLAGLGFLAALWMLIPTRVLFVQVEGNQRIPERQILAAAENCGIRFGASRRAVRSEKVKNAILAELPELKWAGVNTRGCVAVISVREGSAPEEAEKVSGVSSIAADRAGVILSCTVTAGNGLCVPGQAVREGEILISGYTDCGLLIKATRAEGEILAQTRRTLCAVALCDRRICGPVTEESRQYSLIIGKKRINFANSSRICDATCGRMYEEYYITLPGGFVLPVALAVQTHICRETQKSDSLADCMEQELKAFAGDYVSGQMVSGSIQQKTEHFSFGDGICMLDADYLCREMIGKRVQERKVEVNGESD